MANQLITISTPPAGGYAVAGAISNFLLTGTMTPTVATPAVRAGTATTGATNSNIVNVTLSSSIAVGDLMLVAISQNLTSLYNNQWVTPAGWSFVAQVNNYQFLLLFAKFATAADIGATATFNIYASAAVEWAAFSVQNVNPACPFSVVTSTYNTPTQSTFTTNTPQLILGIWSMPNSNLANTQITPPAAMTTLVNPTVGANAPTLAVASMTQSAAGSIGTLTATAVGNGQFMNIGLAINGAVSGGPGVPAGGWQQVGWFGGNQIANPGPIFKTPAASNHANTDWYIYIPASNSGLNIFMFEVFNSSNFTWNAVSRNTASSGDPHPAGTSTPPWSLLNAPASIVGVTYGGQVGASFSPGTGTTEVLLAANADGIFCSVYSGGYLCGLPFYLGSGTTLVSNPSLSDPSPLFSVGFSYEFNSVGQAVSGLAGTTREPGWAMANPTNFGNYFIAPFWPYTGYGPWADQGVVNGSNTTNDLFQCDPSKTLAQRVLLYHTFAIQRSIGGGVRGLLPSWIQWVQSTGCVFGDTSTENGTDTLIFPFNGPSNSNSYNQVWIDSTAA